MSLLISRDALKNSSIDIVLPCYNPLEDWADTILVRANDLMRHYPDHRFRFIVVNDGSTRNIRDEDIEKLEAGLPELEWISYRQNRGKGYALRTGIERTNSDLIIYTDIDLPYTMDSMLKCIDPVLKGEADLSVAVRNESYYDRLPTGRRILSKGLRKMNKTLLRLKAADTQGGLKVFSPKAKQHFLATTIDRYLFDLEFVYNCSRDKDIRVLTVGSDMRDTIEFSKVPIGALRREGWNFVKLMLQGIFR